MTWSWPPFCSPFPLTLSLPYGEKDAKCIHKINEKREKAACTTKKDKNSTVATKCEFYFASVANLRILRLFAQHFRTQPLIWFWKILVICGKIGNNVKESKVKLLAMFVLFE